MVKVPPLLQVKSKFAVMVTTKEKNQLERVATLPARPFILIGRISDIITQGMGPIPREKPTTIATTPTTAKILIMLYKLESFDTASFKKNDTATTRRLMVITEEEIISRSRRPALSSNHVVIPVAITSRFKNGSGIE